MTRIRALVVDDSAVIRRVISELLAGSGRIEVIAAVADPLFALERMRMQWPDVIVLDLEMPRMDGITFLRKIMAERPTPVVICSALTTRGAEKTLQALSAGAVTVVAKPHSGTHGSLHDVSADLVAAVTAAAQANVSNLSRLNGHGEGSPGVVASPLPRAENAHRVVAIGASTGGTVALERLLAALPSASPGVVVVQHMPEGFTAAFAKRLDGACRIDVKEAVDGAELLHGQALIAPAGRHTQLKCSGGRYYVEVRSGPPVNRHRPSVDVLFRSVCTAAGADATGVLLTGMGSDGARGLLELRSAGARTIAQDEQSCVVFGMPREAIKLGAAQQVLGLEEIAPRILKP